MTVVLFPESFSNTHKFFTSFPMDSIQSQYDHEMVVANSFWPKKLFSSYREVRLKKTSLKEGQGCVPGDVVI